MKASSGTGEEGSGNMFELCPYFDIANENQLCDLWNQNNTLTDAIYVLTIELTITSPDSSLPAHPLLPLEQSSCCPEYPDGISCTVLCLLQEQVNQLKEHLQDLLAIQYSHVTLNTPVPVTSTSGFGESYSGTEESYSGSEESGSGKGSGDHYEACPFLDNPVEDLLCDLWNQNHTLTHKITTLNFELNNMNPFSSKPPHPLLPLEEPTSCCSEYPDGVSCPLLCLIQEQVQALKGHAQELQAMQDTLNTTS